MSLSLNETHFDGKTRIFPNPVVSKLTVESKINIDIISIYDINGRLLIMEKLIAPKSEHKLNVNYLRSGVYVLKIESENLKQSKKFIKI